MYKAQIENKTELELHTMAVPVPPGPTLSELLLQLIIKLAEVTKLLMEILLEIVFENF